MAGTIPLLVILLLTGRPVTTVVSPPACEATELRTVAYSAGSSAGTQYRIIATTNVGTRTCTIGLRPELLDRRGDDWRSIRSTPSIQTFGPGIKVLKPNQRAIAALVTNDVADPPGNDECPPRGPRPLEKVAAIRLDTGTVSPLENPFSLERCLRHVGPFSYDTFLTTCERNTSTPCAPIGPPRRIG
jgi:hypothetical protein